MQLLCHLSGKCILNARGVREMWMIRPNFRGGGGGGGVKGGGSAVTQSQAVRSL